jgi:hypothetical protein
MRFFGLFKRVSAVIFALLFAISPVGEVDEESIPKSAEISLVERGSDSVVLRVGIELSSKDGLCGALLRVLYDPSSLVLLGVERNEQSGLEMNTRESCGELLMLFDGAQNSPADCTLATLYFELAAAPSGGEVELFAERGDCVCLMDGKTPCAIEVKASGCVIADEAPYIETCTVAVTAVTEGERDGARIITVQGEITGNVFAVGVRAFTVDIGSAKTQMTVVSRVLKGNSFCFEIPIPAGRACIIMTPLVYNGREMSAGEKLVVIK